MSDTIREDFEAYYPGAAECWTVWGDYKGTAYAPLWEGWQAATERSAARIKELEFGLKKLNAQAEHFERLWYLASGDLEDAQAQFAALEARTLTDAERNAQTKCDARNGTGKAGAT